MTGTGQKLSLRVIALLLLLAVALPLAAQNTPTAAPAASSTTQPTVTNLSKIQVTGIKQLVRTLQTVKVALNQPFSTSPDKADVVVCRITHDHGDLSTEARMGAILECGTNSWFAARREAYHQSGNTTDAVANATNTSVYEHKGAWHSMRALSLQQVKALRTLLNKLPTPDSQQKILVQMDDSKKQ